MTNLMEKRTLALPRLLLFAVFGLSGLQALAVGEGFVPNYLPNSCIVDPQDPFEPNQRMEKGPLGPLCINPVLRRSVKLLPPETAAKYFDVIRPGDVVLANFSHQGRFWVARIPVAAAARVMLQVQYFPVAKLPVWGDVLVAHTQFRFGFAEGEKILLKEQSLATTVASPAVELDGMIFSVENTGPFGEKFDAWKGVRGNYHIAYRAVSVADKFKWMVTDQGHLVTQHGLRFSPVQTRRLLADALAEGHRYGLGREYNTIGPNCSTELFVLLDRVTGEWRWSRPAIPNAAVNALRTRGLLDEKNPLPSFNEEFAGGAP